MVDEHRSRALKEYFTACFLAVLTSFAGLTSAEGMPGPGLLVIVLIALFMVAFVYMQLKQQGDGEDEKIPMSLSRLRRMAVLWYILTIALGGALVKDLIQTMNSAGTKTWVLSALGLGVGIFAISRLLKFIMERRG